MSSDETFKINHSEPELLMKSEIIYYVVNNILLGAPPSWKERVSASKVNSTYIPLMWDWWFFGQKKLDSELLKMVGLGEQGVRVHNDFKWGKPCGTRIKIYPDLVFHYEMSSYPLIENLVKDNEFREKMRNVVVEYDGQYYHKNKISADCEKTKLLLNEDYLVIRFREEGLVDLDLSWHPKKKNLLQISVNPKEIKWQAALRESFAWLDSLR